MDITITYNGQKNKYKSPVTVLEIVGDNKDYICAYVNKRIRELSYLINYDAEIEPLTFKDKDAKDIYEASLRFLVVMAMNNIHPEYQVSLQYGISRSVFLTISNFKDKCNMNLINELNKEMERLISLDYPFERRKITPEEIKKIYTAEGYQDKIEILKYRPEPMCHIYRCNGYQNYMYNRMVPSTSYIRKWQLSFYYPGILISYPRPEKNGTIPPVTTLPAYSKTLAKAHQVGILNGFDSVVHINEKILKYGEIDMINICEQIQNRQLSFIGEEIEKDKNNIKVICIAGPSSSGKTTFANRLRLELMSRGFSPIRISLDDYYLPRQKCPLDENGNLDLESIDALDIALFNDNLMRLIAGEEVELPIFDFNSKKVLKTRKLKIKENQPLIVEGIHALNEKTTSSIPSEQKYRIFISPVAQINIDSHNPLSLTDLRLIRRMVRDFQFRNSPIITTFDMWPSVRAGEFKWIYETQETADYIFNSFNADEFSIFIKYAMPLLRQIDKESTYFPIAERLIRTLKYFVPMDTKWLPCNSILREFTGGSCFEED